MFFLTIIVGIAVLVFIILMLKSFLSPKKISTLNNLIKTGKYQQVIKIAKQLLAKEQSNAELHYLLGQAYNLDKRPELALMEFNKVNKIGNLTGIIDETVFRKAIAELFMQFNQDEEALKEYLLLIKKDPYNSHFQFLAGKLFEKRGRVDNAIGYYMKAIELDKRNDEANFNLGKIYYELKKLTQAKASFEDALKYNPNNLELHYYIGKINKDSKNYPAAIASFEKAQKDTKIRIKSLIEKGLCCMLNNNTESAVSELERVIRLSKEATEGEILNARYFLAACYEKDRKIINAVEQWEAIYEKKPNFKDVGQKLGQYQEIRGDDSMKDFFTASNEKFMDMCIKILENRGYNERERKTIKGGCQIIVVERTTGNWKNLKIQPTLVNFYRIPDPVDEPEFRTFTEDMKKLNIIKGIIFSTSDFTRKALSFIENRPVNTVKKEQLQEELKKINN